MDIRYSCSPEDFKRYTTEETRKEFLITGLYKADKVTAVYSHVDRMTVLGIMPVNRPLPIDDGIDIWANFGTKFFLERREAGVFNLGGDGWIECDGVRYSLGFEDCLYISRSTRQVIFGSDSADVPARFYLVSAPAHKDCKTTFISIKDAGKRPCGSKEGANERVINQFIHPAVLETCQLSMGLTQLSPGSVWNTMPAHTHERRMEVYTYFNIPEGNMVMHLMGRPEETRHIVMNNFDAVISPSWSIHAGCGSSNYTFIWAMGGENQEFDDMDTVAPDALR